MLYSVLNFATRQYDYFQTKEVEPWHSPAPPRAQGASPLGAVPEEAAWVLPASARYLGSGEQAKGRVAVKTRSGSPLSGLGMGDVDPALAVAGTAAAMVIGLAILVKASNHR